MPRLALYPFGIGFGGRIMVGQVVLNGVAVYAFVVTDQDSVRMRLSADDWERLGLMPGQRIRVERPGQTASALLLTAAEHEPPVVWLRLVPLTTRRAS